MSSPPPASAAKVVPDAHDIITPPSTTGSDWEALAVQVLTTRISKILIREKPGEPGQRPVEYILTAGIPTRPGDAVHSKPTLLVNGIADTAPPAVQTFCNRLNLIAEERVAGSVIPWSIISSHICAMSAEKDGICDPNHNIRHIECTWTC
jgi:hypothetical protein